MKMRHSNAHLPLYRKGDASDFIAKVRRVVSNTYFSLLV
jgi:hypothetical protein